MYYYALIDSTTYVCYDMVESETQITDNPYWIQVEAIDKSYIIRKKYVDGVWLDSTPAEAQNAEARTIGIGDEWLDTKIYNIANEVDGKADLTDIPSTLSDLTTDSTHRTVTDAEKTAWNAKSNFSGSYNDLTNKPAIPSAYTHPRSDYDPGDGANDADFVTTMIPKRNATGGTWGGKSFLCDIPRYVGSDSTDTSTEKRIIKVLYVHDDCIKGSYQNASSDRNDVVLRAVYEF